MSPVAKRIAEEVLIKAAELREICREIITLDHLKAKGMSKSNINFFTFGWEL